MMSTTPRPHAHSPTPHELRWVEEVPCELATQVWFAGQPPVAALVSDVTDMKLRLTMRKAAAPGTLLQVDLTDGVAKAGRVRIRVLRTIPQRTGCWQAECELVEDQDDSTDSA